MAKGEISRIDGGRQSLNVGVKVLRRKAVVSLTLQDKLNPGKDIKAHFLL